MIDRVTDRVRRIYAGGNCPRCHELKLIERPAHLGEAWCYGCGADIDVSSQELNNLNSIWERFKALRRVTR